MKKLLVTHRYENQFVLEVPEDAIEEEIFNLIQEEDEYLGGDWDSDWEEIT